jgi:hypothetical protein
MSRLSDGGQKVPTVPALESSGYSYLVRKRSSQTRSHLTTGTFNQFVKDPHGLPPERAVLDRGPGCYAKVSSNLLRRPLLAYYCILRRFCANLLNLSDFHLHVKLNRFSPPRPLKHDVGGLFLRFGIRPAGKKKSRSDASHSAKYQRATSNMRPSRLGSREMNSRVLQWLVLCGIPYRGSGMRHLRISPDPANQLPTSLIGQATRPPGGSTAHLQLPKISTVGSLLQICREKKVSIPKTCAQDMNSLLILLRLRLESAPTLSLAIFASTVFTGGLVEAFWIHLFHS